VVRRKMETVRDPEYDKALAFIQKHHQKKPEKTFLQLIGECKVEYDGRAKSFLDWGQRIVMIKQDGNVLVHQPVMREPINWQPSGSKTSFSVEDAKFIVRSRHTNPSEKMKISFRKIFLITIAQLTDTAQLKIVGMEADVVNQIISNPDCIEEGLRIQKREKQVKSGMIDLFGYDAQHTPVIIEVKRSLATISAVHQLRMYVNDIKHESDHAEVRGILCAPRVPDMVKHLLVDYGLEWQEIERKVVMPDDFQKSLKEFF
jgi:endonuclease